MDETQLANFLAALNAEFKIKRKAESKARHEAREAAIEHKSDFIKPQHLPYSGKFTTTIQFSPITMAAIKLSELHRKKWTSNEADAGELHDAFMNFILIGKKLAELDNDHLRPEKTKKATKGRRLIGATSRAKVRMEAQKMKLMSKESAAPIIGDAVGLSAGKVRAYLSELFPGKEWDQLIRIV